MVVEVVVEVKEVEEVEEEVKIEDKVKRRRRRGRVGGGGGVIQTNQKRVARELRNKHKPRTETGTTPSNQTRRKAGRLNHINLPLK